MSLPKVGQIAEGVVVKVYPRYAIMLFEEGWTGLLHISELSYSYIRHFSGYVSVGNIYNVKVIAVDEQTNSVRVSLKQMTNADRRSAFHHQKVDPGEVDFMALGNRLPKWIKAENESDKDEKGE